MSEFGLSGAGAPMAPGRWYPPYAHAGLTTSLLSTNNRMLAIPFLSSRSSNLQALGIDITVAGEAGSVVRHGVYMDYNGMPGALLADLGTRDATVTGFVSVPGLNTLLPTDWLWIVSGAQGAPTTRPTVRSYQQGAHSRVGDTVGGGAASKMGYSMDSVAGALPAMFIAGGVVGSTLIPTPWLLT